MHQPRLPPNPTDDHKDDQQQAATYNKDTHHTFIANPRSPVIEKTQLHLAVQLGFNPSVIQALLTLPTTDINALDGQRKTPLDYAHPASLTYHLLSQNGAQTSQALVADATRPTQLLSVPLTQATTIFTDVENNDYNDEVVARSEPFNRGQSQQMSKQALSSKNLAEKHTKRSIAQGPPKIGLIADKLDELLNMPSCLEKHLHRLLSYMELVKCSENGIKWSITLSDGSKLEADHLPNIDNTWPLLQEGLQEPAHRKLVEESKQFAVLKNWQEAKKKLVLLRPTIQPVDLSEMFALVRKARVAGSKIKDQNVILLVGKTGAGKSTAIHCWAGSTMGKIKRKDKINHIGPIKLKSQHLKDVTTSPKSQSETTLYCWGPNYRKKRSK